MKKKAIVNMFFSIILYWSAAVLLYRDSIFLSSLKTPGGGSLFSGWSLYLLAFSLIVLGTISLLAARLWSSLGEAEPGWEHLLGPGGVLRRYWYMLILFVAAVSFAFFMAEKVPPPDANRHGSLLLQHDSAAGPGSR